MNPMIPKEMKYNLHYGETVNEITQERSDYVAQPSLGAERISNIGIKHGFSTH